MIKKTQKLQTILFQVIVAKNISFVFINYLQKFTNYQRTVSLKKTTKEQ